MPTPITIGMIDHSAELTRSLVYFEDIDADGLNWPTLFAPTTGKYDLLKVSFITLTKLNLTHTLMGQEIDSSIPTPPGSPSAQRETAMRVSYVDDVTGTKYRFDIPSPVDAIIQQGTDVIDLADVLVAVFKVDFELNCVSPVGNPVTMTGARFVGRRN